MLQQSAKPVHAWPSALHDGVGAWDSHLPFTHALVQQSEAPWQAEPAFLQPVVGAPHTPIEHSDAQHWLKVEQDLPSARHSDVLPACPPCAAWPAIPAPPSLVPPVPLSAVIE